MNGLNIEPNADRILVRPWGNEDRESKLHLPDQMKSVAILTGQVVAVGLGVLHQGTLLPMNTKVGDTILYDARSGIEWRHDGRTFLWLHDSQVTAYVRPKTKAPINGQVKAAEEA